MCSANQSHCVPNVTFKVIVHSELQMTVSVSVPVYQDGASVYSRVHAHCETLPQSTGVAARRQLRAHAAVGAASVAGQLRTQRRHQQARW